MFFVYLFVCFSVLSMFLNFLMLFELLLVCLCMFELFLAVCVVFDTKNDIDDMFCCVVWFAVFFIISCMFWLSLLKLVCFDSFVGFCVFGGGGDWWTHGAFGVRN